MENIYHDILLQILGFDHYMQDIKSMQDTSSINGVSFHLGLPNRQCCTSASPSWDLRDGSTHTLEKASETLSKHGSNPLTSLPNLGFMKLKSCLKMVRTLFLWKIVPILRWLLKKSPGHLVKTCHSLRRRTSQCDAISIKTHIKTMFIVLSRFLSTEKSVTPHSTKSYSSQW